VDPTVLASQALALLGPYLTKAGEAAAGKVGEAAAKHADAILGAIRRKFGADHDTYAEQTLAKVEKEPHAEWPKQALQGLLTEKVQEDPAFMAELERLLQSAKQDPATQQFLVQVYGGQVGEIFQIGSVQTLNVGRREGAQPSG
jgi:hypothetical protein